MTQRRGRFADLPPITDFESCQRVRPLLLHRIGDVVGVWRFCPNKTCQRARSCRRGDGHCFIAFMQAAPDTERRRLRYALDNRLAGLDSDEACRRADARIEEEIARDAAERQVAEGLDPCSPPSPSSWTSRVSGADPE